jgi:RNA-binding protein
MKRLGEVVRTAQGLAVVRSPDDAGSDDGTPAIGTGVVDESLTDVGRVVDVFGPVERPYVAVSPDDGVRLAALVGSKVYARDGA